MIEAIGLVYVLGFVMTGVVLGRPLVPLTPKEAVGVGLLAMGWPFMVAVYGVRFAMECVEEVTDERR